MKNPKAILIAVLFAFPALATAQNPDLEKKLSQFVNMEVDFSKTPSVFVGIIEGDSIYTYAFGTLQKGDTVLPNQNTIFEIGSLTKIFTAIALQTLVSEGKISYEQPLTAYLPAEMLHPNLQNISVFELATHTSGLPRLPTNFGEYTDDPNNPYKNYENSDFDIFLKNFDQLGAKRYVYSHVNYALLERILEAVEGKELAEIIAEKITAPLQMKDTRHDLTAAQAERLCEGYLLDGEIAPKSEVRSFYGAVGMKSTMHDLTRFVQFCISETAADSLRTLHENVRTIQTAKINTGIESFIDAGIGWHIVRPRKRFYPVVAHRGTGTGHQVYVAFVPETQTGVVILANARNSLEGLGYFLLKMINYNWKKPKR